MSISTSELSPYLDAGERTLWHGAPPTGIMFRRQDVFMIPFSFLWFGFALVWESLALGITVNSPQSPPFFFPLFGFFFVCVGFYMAFGRFFWDAFVRGRTLYALTNRRAIILARVPFQQLRSIGLTPSTEVSTEERGDGTGTIIFGARSAVPAIWRGWSATGSGSGEFMFERVSDDRAVIQSIRQIQTPSK